MRFFVWCALAYFLKLWGFESEKLSWIFLTQFKNVQRIYFLWGFGYFFLLSMDTFLQGWLIPLLLMKYHGNWWVSNLLDRLHTCHNLVHRSSCVPVTVTEMLYPLGREWFKRLHLPSLGEFSGVFSHPLILSHDSLLLYNSNLRAGHHYQRCRKYVSPLTRRIKTGRREFYRESGTIISARPLADLSVARVAEALTLFRGRRNARAEALVKGAWSKAITTGK